MTGDKVAEKPGWGVGRDLSSFAWSLFIKAVPQKDLERTPCRHRGGTENS
jgi:hypothetical protein